MKKLILTCLMAVLSTSSVYAHPHCDDDDYDCGNQYRLQISLRNFGSEVCVLKKKYIIQGYVYQSDVPTILSDSGEVYAFNMRGKETEAKLYYQCGEYKKFTLYMHQLLKRKHYHTSIEAKMMDATDVFEKHTTKEVNTRYCNASSNQGQISWQISH